MTEEKILHRNLAVLRVSDPKVFDEVRAVLPLDDYCFGQLGETELLIDPRRLKEVINRLDARGLSPLIKRE